MSFYLLLSWLLISLVYLKDAGPFLVPKKQDESPMIGDGEDYFLSLFGDSKKLTAHSKHTQKTLKYFSMILEEVGQFTARYVFYLNYLISSVRVGPISQQKIKF